MNVNNDILNEAKVLTREYTNVFKYLKKCMYIYLKTHAGTMGKPGMFKNRARWLFELNILKQQ
jgi:hypothetical protein